MQTEKHEIGDIIEREYKGKVYKWKVTKENKKSYEIVYNSLVFDPEEPKHIMCRLLRKDTGRIVH